jgi:hypothetical protein
VDTGIMYCVVFPELNTVLRSFVLPWRGSQKETTTTLPKLGEPRTPVMVSQTAGHSRILIRVMSTKIQHN